MKKEQVETSEAYSFSDLVIMRGSILHHFSSLEMGISAYITRYYLGKDNFDFVHTVLYDKYRNFMSLFSIYKNLLKRDNVDFPFSKLQRLMEIRNIFAHAWISSPDPNANKFNLIGSDGMKDTRKAKKLFDEFIEIFSEVQLIINKTNVARFNSPNS